MKIDFITWITFEILLGNWIFAWIELNIATPRFMGTPFEVLKLNFHLGNADFDRGTLRKYLNRNMKISTKNDESRFSEG